MLASTLLYSAVVVMCVGLVAVVRPLPAVQLQTRTHGTVVAVVALSAAVGVLLLPAFEARNGGSARLDEFAPAWQFHEVHTMQIAAPPARVFAAIKDVRADEIFLFHTLTWIRRGGRPAPPSILDAASHEPLIGVAVKGGFLVLADEAPREIVIGTIVGAPPGPRARATAAIFKSPPPDFAVAVMNFAVTPDGAGGSIVSTETRVFANGAAARRRFAAYWRVIYPGSALIRRMWLRAIERRAR
jgi:hypothetical protein